MVCSAASASSRAGLAASSLSSATALSAYNDNMTTSQVTLPLITQVTIALVSHTYINTNKNKFIRQHAIAKFMTMTAPKLK